MWDRYDESDGLNSFATRLIKIKLIREIWKIYLLLERKPRFDSGRVSVFKAVLKEENHLKNFQKKIFIQLN